MFLERQKVKGFIFSVKPVFWRIFLSACTYQDGMKSKLSLSKKQRVAEKKERYILSCKGWAELRSGGIRESLAAISELQLRLVRVPELWGHLADQHLPSPHPHLPLPVLGHRGGAQTLQLCNCSSSP